MPHNNLFLWVALDGLGRADSHVTPDLLHRMHEISGNWGWKINLDTLINFGATWAAARLPDHDAMWRRARFADVKGHNGRRTLERLLEPLANAGFTHVNFHVGDSDDLRPIVERARYLGIITMGVTQLSHGEVSVKRVQELVEKAEEFGFSEVILPAFVADKIKTDLGILGTGFRRQGPDEHQPHALHPREARGLVDSVAIGSPIMEADDPVSALQQHLNWLRGD